MMKLLSSFLKYDFILFRLPIQDGYSSSTEFWFELAIRSGNRTSRAL